MSSQANGCERFAQGPISDLPEELLLTIDGNAVASLLLNEELGFVTK